MLTNPLPISPLAGPVDAVVRVPGSKSYTNRALLIAALAEGHSTLEGALFSDDTERMADSLGRLGIRVEAHPEDSRFEIWGTGGKLPAREARLDVGNAGTAARFLTPVLALGRGRYVLDGTSRMRERPIQPLLDALQALGVRAYSEAGTGCPPVIVEAAGLSGGEVRMRGDQSSQYFSALLQVGPLTRTGIRIHVDGEMVSAPYIDMTAAMMAEFGASMTRDAACSELAVAGRQGYHARKLAIEPDASNASYFFAAAALSGGRVRVPGLGACSLQGDLRLLGALEMMGCRVERANDWIEVRGPSRLRGITVDARDFSDMAQTLYALAVFADGPSEIRNVAHSRLQECDRVAASAAELRRLGQEVHEYPDGLRIVPHPVRPAAVSTYDDHRMAMAFALVGLGAPGVSIWNPSCTAKTFPGYWEALEGLRTGSAR